MSGHSVFSNSGLKEVQKEKRMLARNDSHQVELGDQELKTIVEILRYSLDYCPIEGVSYEMNITHDQVEALIGKLERALKPR